jgi:YVTN family beta-propeller protein
MIIAQSRFLYHEDNINDNLILASDDGNKDNISSVDTKTIYKNDTLVYKDPKLNYSISYPRNWIKYDDVLGTWFSSQKDHPPQTGLHIMVIPINAANVNTFDAFLSEHVMANKLYSDISFELIEAKEINIGKGNYSAYLLAYKLATLQVYDYFILNGDNIYNLQYIEIPSKFGFSLPLITKIIESFEIQDTKDIVYPDNMPGIHVANFPQGLSINPNTNKLYVADYGSNLVSVIDLETNTVVDNITVGSKPHDVAVIPFDNSIYVTNYGSDTISVIDGVTNTITSTVKVGSRPMNIAVDPDENERIIFVSNRDSNTVSVIGAEFANKITDIEVGSFPLGLDVNPITNRLYVVNGENDTLSIIDYYLENRSSFKHNRVDVPVGMDPVDTAVDQSSNTIFVTNSFSNTISVINGSTNQVIRNLTAVTPAFMSINPNTHLILVTSESFKTVYLIDSINYTAKKIIYLPDRPRYVYVNRDNNLAYVSSDLTNTIHVINGTSQNVVTGVLFKTIPPGSGYINCEGAKHYNNDYRLFDYNSTVYCDSQPRNDFRFTSWSGSSLPTSNSININNNRDIVTVLNLTHYGTVIANFEEVFTLPEAVRELLLLIITSVIAAPIVGWLIPFIISEREKKRQLRYMKAYLPLIDNIYKEFRTNKDKCLQLLEQKNIDSMALLKEGIITSSTYRVLADRINKYIDSISQSRNN